jgi:hypothetical protein
MHISCALLPYLVAALKRNTQPTRPPLGPGFITLCGLVAVAGDREKRSFCKIFFLWVHHENRGSTERKTVDPLFLGSELLEQLLT